MKDGQAPLETNLSGLKKGDWIDELASIAEELGHFQPLGERHCAAFIDEGPILLVSFESVQGIAALSETAQPMGFELVRNNGWSLLSLVADGDTWFRDPNVYRYIDRLSDDGFFEDFDRVVFYGAGPCGYAAAAFSVASPGARVLAIQPQATLEPDVTLWDDRFVHMRRVNFTDRYGYAPDMIDAAEVAYVVFDPTEPLDAMHAALFTAKHVRPLMMRRMGVALQSDLIALDLLVPLIEAIASDDFEPLEFYRALRARRDYPPYLSGLLARVDAQDRPELALALCRNVLGRMTSPRIARRMAQLEEELGLEGEDAPGARPARGAV